MNIKMLIDPENEIWTVRRGAVATIQLRISHSRYVHGEAVIETRYRLSDGVEDQDPTSRIWLGNSRREIVVQLYDKLLDAVLIARQFDALEVVIDFQRETLGEWDQDFCVTAYIVAHELDVPIAGIVLSELVAQSGRLVTLSDDLSRVLFGEEDSSEQ